MANNINREGFKRFLELGAPSFEGNIILDSGELSEYYYRFMRIPLAYGEHKVDVLYGQRFYGTLENKPVTFNQEIRFLCLVVDNAKTVNETLDFKTIFCRSSFTSDSVIEEMAQKLFDMFRENVTEEDKKKILKGGYYDQTARQNAFCRIIKGYKNYRSPIDSIVDEIGKGSCFGLTSTNADELVVDYLANPTGWAERTMERIKKASLEYSGLQFWITLAMTEELTEEYVKKYSNPDTPEGKFKSLTDSIKNYKNTVATRIGVQYHACKFVTARLGMYVDESPVRSDFLNPETPSMTKVSYTAGVTINPCKNVSIDLAYGYITSADPERTGSCDYYNSLTYKAVYAQTYGQLIAGGMAPEQAKIQAHTTANDKAIQPFSGNYSLSAHTFAIGVNLKF